MSQAVDKLNHDVRRLGALGQYAQAAELCQQIIDQPPDSNLESAARTGLASILTITGHVDQATVQLEQALQIARDIQDACNEADALIGQGVIHQFATGRHHRMMDYAQQALHLARGAGYRDGECEALYLIGSVYTHRKKFREARRHFEQAMSIAREMENRIAEIDIRNGFGIAAFRQSHFADALHDFENALQMARAEGYRGQEVVNLLNVGLLQFMGIRQTQQALVNIRQGLKIARELGDRYGELNGLLLLGHAAYQMEDYAEAQTCFEQAQAVRESAGFSAQESYILSWLGMIAYRKHNYLQALTHYRRVREILIAEGNRRGARNLRYSLVVIRIRHCLTFDWLFKSTTPVQP